MSYGILNGVGAGITYFVPIVCAWEYFPKNKGLVAGIIIGAFGFGPFIFIQLATKIVNPDNLGTEIEVSSILSFFGPDVAERVPKMFRILGLIWLCQVALSISMISKPEKCKLEPEGNSAENPLIQESQPTYQLTSVSAAFKSKRFTQYFLMMLLGIVF